ncbi:MAG: hypothetical protein ABL908_14495 [Hyphomicrobium sp.]
MPAAVTAFAPEIVTRDGAACTVHRDAPRWGDAATAAIGGFSCASAEAGASLLGEVCATLAREGFAAAVGPMDGDTWHAYRLVTETDGSPSFPLEPRSGALDSLAFTAAGFEPISHYVSARASLADAIESVRPDSRGLTVETWDGANAEALLGQVFDMSLAAFQRNAFYKPITRTAFVDLYRPVIPAMDRRFILFARTPDRAVVGFLFAYPNVFEGPRPSSLVVKTYASGVRGAGRLMVDAVHRAARDHGFSHAIHALMHIDNQSLERSALHGGTIFRRYALMGRGLTTTTPNTSAR